MDSLLAYAQAKQNELLAFVEELVRCETPSRNEGAISRFADLFADRVRDVATVRRIPQKGYGPLLQCTFKLPGRRKDAQILALGHSDTVYEIGQINTMPWRLANGRAYGPGVLDMKCGVAMFVYAMRGLIESGVPVKRNVVLQLNPDEEIGSPVSRNITEEQARKSMTVLVVEPGTGLEGKAKTARKGIANLRLLVKGKAAHSGVDFAAGASAVVELCHQVVAASKLTGLRSGLTVNIGWIKGGTRDNIVAPEAEAAIEYRVVKLRDAPVVERKLRALRPVDKRCSLEITGGLNRPPLERSAGVVTLFRQARSLANELGVVLEESSTGGGSDGNFTAALGIPTLDGIGAIGDGAHTPNEYVLTERIADRTALLAKLVASL